MGRSSTPGLPVDRPLRFERRGRDRVRTLMQRTHRWPFNNHQFAGKHREARMHIVAACQSRPSDMARSGFATAEILSSANANHLVVGPWLEQSYASHLQPVSYIARRVRRRLAPKASNRYLWYVTVSFASCDLAMPTIREAAHGLGLPSRVRLAKSAQRLCLCVSSKPKRSWPATRAAKHSPKARGGEKTGRQK
jgi:hypothetical protein